MRSADKKQTTAKSKSTKTGKPLAPDSDAIPFVPAWDLLENEEQSLTPEEAACVALALLGGRIPTSGDSHAKWALEARMAGVSRRVSRHG